MVSNVVFIVFWVISIFYHVECIVTDKEYASLPAIFEQDNFERCMLFEDEALYCSVEFHLKPLDTYKPSLAWQKIQELNSDPNNYQHNKLRHGICVPLTCPNISTSYKEPGFKDDLANCYGKKYEKDGLYGTIGYMHCQTAEGPPFDIYDYLVAIVSVIYIIFLMYATFYEGLARYKSKEEYDELTRTTYGKILSCFSITKNWLRLNTVTWTPELKALKNIQGVRVYSMFLVITCHASMMASMGPISNTKFTENLPRHPLTVIIASGPYGVEGFFLISSWMLTYNIFKQFDKQSGKKLDLKTVFNIFIQRYIRAGFMKTFDVMHPLSFRDKCSIMKSMPHFVEAQDRLFCSTRKSSVMPRLSPSEAAISISKHLLMTPKQEKLTPPMAVMLMLHSTLFYHTSTGPWWELQVGRDRTSCRQNGWTNLLYINNLINTTKMCMIETWYMAVDMHGFFLVLTILYFTVKKPERLWWLIPSVWLLIQTKHLKDIYESDVYTYLSPTAENIYLLNGLLNGKTWILTLASTSANMGGTLVGMVAGYVYYKYEYVQFTPKKIHIFFWWLISLGVSLGIVVLPGFWIFSKNYYPTFWFSLPYFLFNTTIFGIGISTTLIGFTKGIGWMAKWCVEWDPLYILGRLSYSCFLVHYTIGTLELGTFTAVKHSNSMSILFETMKLLMSSFFFALILTLTVEMPVTALQSTFMKKSAESESKKSLNGNKNKEINQRLKKS